MANYKEMVTKAFIGKGKKNFTTNNIHRQLKNVSFFNFFRILQP